MRVCPAAIAVAIFFTASPAARADEPTIQTTSILSGSVAVQALRYVTYPVTVTPNLMTDPRIVGHVQVSGGTGNDIDVMVLSDTDFLNWKNNHAVAPLYHSGQVTAADINLPVPAAGDYIVVLSNVFSPLTPKTVAGNIHLAWIPPALIEKRDKLVAADNFMHIFFPVFAALMMGGFFWWWASRWTKAQKKNEAAEEKKAA